MSPRKNYPEELRKRAGQARRAATIRTYGDSMADRELMRLAEELEREADDHERKSD